MQVTQAEQREQAPPPECSLCDSGTRPHHRLTLLGDPIVVFFLRRAAFADMLKGSHKSSAICGALWLVDNDSDTNLTRDEQDVRIKSYLSQHAHYCYYGRSFKPENVGPMTVARFRNVMACAITSNSLQEEDKSSVDLLWELKSQGLPPEYLSTHGYNKNTFTAKDLPGPPTTTMDDNVTLHSASSATEKTKSTTTLKIRVNPPHARKPRFPTAMPSCRSQFIVVLDVEKSLASRADKYQDQATRSRAVLLLIKQYNLTYYNKHRDTVVEILPQQLMDSLRKLFTRSDQESEHIAMADFWKDDSQQARRLMLVSEQDVQQYEMEEELPAYGAFPFAHTSRDVELALLGMGYGPIADEIQLETSTMPPTEKRLSLNKPPVTNRGSDHNRFSQFVVIQDIDASKADCENNDYKYRSRESQFRALKLIIQRFSLQRWTMKDNAIVDMTEDELHKLMMRLFSQNKEKSGKAGFTGDIVWSEGSRAFGARVMARLRDSADRIVALRAQDTDSLSVPAKLTLSADADGVLLEKNDSRRNTIASKSSSNDSKDPPPTLSRKRKAKEAELPSRRNSEASRHEQDDDFVPSDPPSQMSTQGTKSLFSIPLDLTSPTSQRPRRTSSQQQQSVLQIDSDGKWHEDRLQVKSTDGTPTYSHLVPGTTPDEIDLRRLGSSTASISSSIQHAVSSLFSDLHLDIALPSPFPNASDEELETLFSRCWGVDWQSTCQVMTKFRIFDAFNVMKALVAAFLFERVLKDGGCWQIEMFKHLGLSLPGREESEEAFFDLASLNLDRMLEAQRRARIFVADTILQSDLSELHEYADKLAESFTFLVRGHITALSDYSKFLQPYNGYVDIVVLVEKFRNQLSRVMKEAIDLKLHLSHSRHNHQFFWPTTGTTFDPTQMECVYLSHCEQEDQLVGFTLFPGLTVEIDNQKHHVRPAETVTRVQDIRVGSSSSIARSGVSLA